MIYKKRCETCGNPFESTRRDARYCKPYCRLVPFRKRNELIVARAERELRSTLEGVESGRLTGAQAKAKLGRFLLDKVKVPKEVKDLIRNL